MLLYAALRIAQALVVVVGAYTLTFIGIHLLPTDPIVNYLVANEMSLDPETIHQMKQYYGYDRPLHEQFFSQLWGIAQGNFGYSLKTARPVTTEISDVILSTLQLAGTATLIALLAAFLLVTINSLTTSKRLSAIVVSVPPLISAVPTFLLGMVMLQIFSFKLGWLSVFPDGSLLSLLMPALALGLHLSAPLAQVMIKAVESARAQPFVVAVRAKGVTRIGLFFRHLLKFAASSGLTMLGLIVGGLLAGSVVTETVFSRPGVGRVLQEAVSSQDIAVVQGFVILIAAIYAFTNLIVDLIYPMLDPRVAITAPAR